MKDAIPPKTLLVGSEASLKYESRPGTYGGIFPYLQLQISNYSTQRTNGNPALPARATTLFTIWSGANDVFASVEKGDPVTPQEVADNIATSWACSPSAKNHSPKKPQSPTKNRKSL